jgi:predicted HTH transcriptional regulator
MLPAPYEIENGQEVSGDRIFEAFTEALVNGLCNADYLSGASLLLVATPREMLFRNSGKPYISVDDMIAGGMSEPRNTEIMRFFRLLRFSQRTGYGVSNIYSAMREYGYPTPSLNVHSSPDCTELRLFLFGRGVQSGSTKLSTQEVLSVIASSDGIGQRELTERFGVTRKTMMGMLNALLASGQIRTNGNKTKGRLYYIQGTNPYGK